MLVYQYISFKKISASSKVFVDCMIYMGELEEASFFSVIATHYWGIS